MTNTEAFLLQWDSLKEEMARTIRSQLDKGTGIRFEELNRVYQTKKKRWSARMTEEGRWMDAVENTECQREVLDALAGLTLTEVPVKNVNKGSAAAAAFCGAAAGGIGGYLIDSSVLLKAVPAAACGALAFGIVNSRNSQIQKQRERETVQAYLSQIDAAGEKIAGIWRRYEPENH